jgi:hypothetical protein
MAQVVDVYEDVYESFSSNPKTAKKNFFKLKTWLQSWGYSSVVERLLSMC